LRGAGGARIAPRIHLFRFRSARKPGAIRRRNCLKIPFAIAPKGSESSGLMSFPNMPDQMPETPPTSKLRGLVEPDFTGPPKPIAEFAGRPDFPDCAVGEFVDIGGFSGVLVRIVNHSIKVRSPDGITQSFNFHRLRQLYGPVVRAEPRESESGRASAAPAPPAPAVEPAEPPPAAPEPQRRFIAEPNFANPPRSIREFAGRADFPECAYGEHIDIGGYAGVVVEIVNQSLKVRSAAGVTQRYNVVGLRKLFGKT
jgi:hypothetical protein